LIVAFRKWCLIAATIGVGVFNFLMLVRKFEMNSWWWFLFCFMVFTSLVNTNLKKKKDWWKRTSLS
jgi:hypothetical protein